MAHRNGKPKPSARERTWYRYRTRKDIDTPEDIQRRNAFEAVKDWIFKMRHPELDVRIN